MMDDIGLYLGALESRAELSSMLDGSQEVKGKNNRKFSV